MRNTVRLQVLYDCVIQMLRKIKVLVLRECQEYYAKSIVSISSSESLDTGFLSVQDCFLTLAGMKSSSLVHVSP